MTKAQQTLKMHRNIATRHNAAQIRAPEGATSRRRSAQKPEEVGCSGWSVEGVAALQPSQGDWGDPAQDRAVSTTGHMVLRELVQG